MLKTPLDLLKNLFSRGMTISPLFFTQVRGVNLEKEGIVRIERAPVVLTGATLDAIVNWTVITNGGDVYLLTSNGKLWLTTDYTSISQVQGTSYNATTESTNAHGNGLAFWKGCIWRARDQLVDYYDIANTTWHYGIKTLKVLRTGLNPMFVGQDDKLYAGNDQYVNVISETSAGSFVPSTEAGLAAIDDDALILPKDYVINCFAELNEKLAIGTIYGTVQVNTKVADVFLWDRSDTTTSFTTIIRLNEEGINSMLVSNNLLYISAGFSGNIYVSNGISSQSYVNVPLDTKEKTGSPSALYLEVMPDAFDFQGDELLVGASQNVDNATKTENPMGVYGFIGKVARFLGNGSYAKDGSDGTQIKVGSIYSISPNEYLVSWKCGTDYGVDYYGPNNNRIVSYGAYLEGEVHLLGIHINPATIEHFDFYLAKPLVSGDGVRLKYRTSNSGSWTTVATMDSATHTGINFFSFAYTISNIKTIQFRIELTATSTTTPELRTILAY